MTAAASHTSNPPAGISDPRRRATRRGDPHLAVPQRVAGSEACPLCGAPLSPEQDWCLRCGAAARTRLAATPNWKAPIATIAVVAALALGVLAAALVKLAGGSGHPAPRRRRQPLRRLPPATPPTTVPGAATTPTAPARAPATTRRRPPRRRRDARPPRRGHAGRHGDAHDDRRRRHRRQDAPARSTGQTTLERLRPARSLNKFQRTPPAANSRRGARADCEIPFRDARASTGGLARDRRRGRRRGRRRALRGALRRARAARGRADLRHAARADGQLLGAGRPRRGARRRRQLRAAPRATPSCAGRGLVRALGRRDPRRARRPSWCATCSRSASASTPTASGSLALGLEGGHSVRRVVHAGGSATGRRVVRQLSALVAEEPRIAVLEGARARALWRSDGRCAGLICDDGRIVARARSCSPPAAPPRCGRARPTRPARRASACCSRTRRRRARRPRAAAVPPHRRDRRRRARGLSRHRGDPRRGRDAARRGRRALRRRARAARRGLARDPGAPATSPASARSGWTCARRPGALPQRRRRAARGRPRPARELIPVAPAAHYMMGGIVADLHARSTLPGLYAVGESSCTGLHGANRLASNSLSECFVFARRAVAARARRAAPARRAAERGRSCERLRALPAPPVGDAGDARGAVARRRHRAQRRRA